MGRKKVKPVNRKPGSYITAAARNDDWYLKKLAQRRDRRMRAKRAAKSPPKDVDKLTDELVKELGFSE